MDIDRNISSDEMLQPATVVEVQMSYDDGLHVLDTVSRLGNSLVEVMLNRVVVDLGKDVVDGSLGWVSVSPLQNHNAREEWRGAVALVSVHQQPLLG